MSDFPTSSHPDAWERYKPKPALARCGRCHRVTFAEDEVGRECRMTQPDGYPCGGTFEPSNRRTIADVMAEYEKDGMGGSR